MSTHRSEQETIIRFDQTKGEVAIFTASPVIRRKLEKRGLIAWKVRKTRGVPGGWFYRTPYRTLHWSVRPPRTAPKRGVLEATDGRER